VVIFGPLDKVIKSDDFKGGKVVVVFGGGDIDISQVRTSESQIDLEFVAVFGGGRLIVPEDWKVNSQGTAVLGTYDNHARGVEGQTTINVRGSAVLGSVEIVN
jgi:predicted membrane protein